MNKCILVFLFLLCGFSVSAGHFDYVYWVQFNTKTGTPYKLSEPETFLSPRALERRVKMNIAIDSTDLPVNPDFLLYLKDAGFGIKHTSRWMNGAILTSPDFIDHEKLELPDYIDFIEVRKEVDYKSSNNKFEEIDSLTQNYYGESFSQINLMNGNRVHEHSRGEGIQIAVIDAGFENANQISPLDSLYARNGVLGTFDFVSPGSNVYTEHPHGTYVLSILAGNKPGALIGSAPDASYWLLRSEDVNSEFPVEEDYWIIATEFADSVGCDVVNTSLGYSLFDDPKFNHEYSDFDGNTLRISKAANLAVDKGMVIVCSAGNSGRAGDAWGHIVAPSEAEKVLSVAAVNSTGDSVDFSSWGFTGQGALPKPDIAAMGQGVTFSGTSGSLLRGGGTSFSSPLVAGMAACLLNLYPDYTATDIIDLIRKLGDRYPEHDPKFGYGVPNFSKAVEDNNSTDLIVENQGKVLFPNPFTSKLMLPKKHSYHSLTFYTFDGRKVLSTKLFENQSQLSSEELSILPKGMYFVLLKNNKGYTSAKLIKE